VVDDSGELVTRGAVDRPLGRQAFIRPKNLFDDEIDGRVRLLGRLADRLGRARLETV